MSSSRSKGLICSPVICYRDVKSMTFCRLTATEVKVMFEATLRGW